LKLEYDKLLSTFAFNFNLRRYDMGGGRPAPMCRLTPGGTPQPPYEGATGAAAGATAYAAQTQNEQSRSSDSSFFDAVKPGGASNKGQVGPGSIACHFVGFIAKNRKRVLN
jgi:collagen type III alpha/collagen type V/XI/XXIV/XXVII alpha